LLLIGVSANGFEIDPSNAIPQLSMLMANAQKSLARAQRHHAKVVDKIRKEIEIDFTNESTAFGNAIGEYAVELDQAEKLMENAEASATAGLKKESEIPSKPDDWEDPGVAQRARLSAELGASHRALSHLQRTNERALKEASDSAGQIFEDESMKLSMKLGDLSSTSDEAKQNMAAVEIAKRQNLSTPSNKTHFATGKEQLARLQAYGKELKDAQKQSSIVTVAAKNKFEAFLAKTTLEAQRAGDKVLDELKVAQEKEVDKVLKKTTVFVKASSTPKKNASHPSNTSALHHA